MARFFVFSGGTADYTRINNGIMNISGVASNTTLFGGQVVADSGGAAYGTLVNSGVLLVYGGGVANNTTVDSSGELRIVNGGVARNITVYYNCGIVISSGGTATGQMWFAENAVISAEEGSIFNFDISGASPETIVVGNSLSAVKGTPTFTLTVSGTQADGRYCLGEGVADFDKTISVQDTSGTTLDTITVAEGGKFIGGRKYMLSLDGYSLFLTIGDSFDLSGDLNSAADLTSGMTGSSVNILSGGTLNILDGGFASMTTIDSGGAMYVSDGGKADGITANYGGELGVYGASGGTATQVRENGGYVTIGSGSIVTFVPNSFSGYIYAGRQWATIHSGTTGTDLTAGSQGYIYVTGGIANGITVNASGYLGVLNGGTANNVTVNHLGRMNVISNGTVNSATLNSGGNLEVSSGGTATSTTVNGSASMHVSNGGTANNTTVDYYGRMYVWSGGTADATTVNNGGILEVFGTATNVVWTPFTGNVEIRDGAYVTFVSQYSGVYFGSGDQLLSSAMVMESKTVSGDDFTAMKMYVMSGGTAINTTVDYYGRMYVWSGGTADATTLNGSASMHVSNGGTAINTTLNLRGSMYISSGGTADSTTVNSNGCMQVSSGATANITTVRSKGMLIVWSGGTADATTVNNGGSMHVSGSGGTANSTTVDGGELVVSVGGTVDATTVISSGSMHVSWGGMANNTTVSSGGMAVFSSGTANNTMVYEKGSMHVSSGGTAINTTVNARGGMYVSSGGTADTATVISFGGIHVFNGGTANSTTLDTDGELYVSSGGTATNTTINRDGRLYVSNGGTADTTTINSWGTLYVQSGGVASNTSVNSIGRAYISGKITGKMSFEKNATVSAYKGAIIDFALAGIRPDSEVRLNNLSQVENWSAASFTITVDGSEPVGIYKLADGAAGFDKTITVKNTAGKTLGTLTVAGGTKTFGGQDYKLSLTDSMLSVIVGDPDKVFSGTVTSETKIIASGSSAIGATVNESGVLIIQNGAIAQNIQINSRGVIFVSSGGKAEGLIVESDGAASIGTDLVATDVVVHSGGILFDKGACAYRYSSGNLVQSNFVMSGGYLLINGGRVEGAIISKGDIEISSGGLLAEATLMHADVDVHAKASISEMTVSDGAIVRVLSGSDVQHLRVNSGGTLTGTMRDISDLSFNGGTLELNVSRMAPGNDFLVDANTFGGIDKNDAYTVTLKIQLAPIYSDYGVTGGPGTYQLIEGAAGFDKTITVVNSISEEIGKLTLGRTSKIESYYVTLNLDATNNNLTVTVSEDDPRPTPSGTAKSDIDGNGISDVMFVWTGNNYQHGYWMNGTSTWQSAGSSHPAEWENLGCYDMTGDGKADSVLFGNVTSEAGIKGAYIGYYADANDLPDGSTWVNIGYLNNADDIAWKNKVGNLTGGSANSIVWYAPELYALGAWTDGTETWVSLSKVFGGDAWTLVGCGDFDGDGKDSVLMTLNGGQMFYTVGIDGAEPQRLGFNNWSGWEVRAIGDFKGDGKDDLVLFHKETGSMVMCADGSVDDFVSIGQLDANDWFVVGAGDYNADGNDDLLVRQYTTGMLGYYDAGDVANGWVELGRGVDMNWTVIA